MDFGIDFNKIIHDLGSSNGLGGVKNWLTGDPDAIKKAYDQAIADARTGGRDIASFLMGRQGNAQQYFQPLQNMFNTAYGTQGIAAPQVPAPAQGQILNSIYGGR